MSAVVGVIVNYRTSRLTIDLTHRILHDLDVCVDRVVVVDNSEDANELDLLRRGLDLEDRVLVVDSGKNRGFAGGVNLAFSKLANDDVAWILNSDTVPGVDSLAWVLDALTDFDIVGSVLQNTDGSVQSFGGTWKILIGIPEHLTSAPSGALRYKRPWVHGAAMLLSHSTWSLLDGLDERFFLYFEEADFCVRARAKSMTVGVETRSVLLHAESTSLGGTQSLPRDIYLARNSVLFLEKRYGRYLGLVVGAASLGVVYSVRILRGERQRSAALLRGLRLAYNNRWGRIS